MHHKSRNTDQTCRALPVINSPSSGVQAQSDPHDAAQPGLQVPPHGQPDLPYPAHVHHHHEEADYHPAIRPYEDATKHSNKFIRSSFSQLICQHTDRS